MKDPLKNDRGIALTVGIMVVVLLLIIIGAIMALGRLDLKKTSNHKLGTQALEIADAALQHALTVIPDGANFPYTSPTTIIPSGTVYLSMPGFTYTVVASNINGGVQAILTATAEHTASGAKRVIEAYADRGTYGLGAVHLEGSAGVMETEFAGTSFEISGTDECGVQPTVAGITVTDPDLETEITNDTTALSANIGETLTLPEFSVEGGEGIDDGNDGCYAIIHLGGGSDGEADAAAIHSGVQAGSVAESRCLQSSW